MRSFLPFELSALIICAAATSRCLLPAEVGPCRAAFPKFFWNSGSRKCEAFTYGGCDGNDNNFETVEECEQTCGGTKASSDGLSDDWRRVKRGESVPAGGHYRLNLQTGETEVKRLVTDEVEKTDGPVFHVDDGRPYKLQDAPTDFLGIEEVPSNEEDERKAAELRQKYRPYSQLKREMSEIKAAIKSELELVDEYVTQLNAANVSDSSNLLWLFEQFEYLLHNFDNAVLFGDLGGFGSALRFVNASKFDLPVVNGALLTLGVALQNNPQVQKVALSSPDLINRLFTALPFTPARTVFVISALLRNNPPMIETFLENDGVGKISNLINSDAGSKLLVKVINLFHDIIHISNNQSILPRLREDGGEVLCHRLTSGGAYRLSLHSAVALIDQLSCAISPEFAEQLRKTLADDEEDETVRILDEADVAAIRKLIRKGFAPLN